MAPNESNDPQRSMLLGQLAGKHNAARVYDERIWKIRTGFLTLMFGGWAALLGLGTIEDTKAMSGSMLVVTLALAIAAFIVELFYVRRKFRCVHRINEMSIGLFNAVGEEAQLIPEESVVAWLRFTGDDRTVRIPGKDGYLDAVLETCLIYFIPVLGVVVALWQF